MALHARRSSVVVLGSMGVLAAALSACSSEPDRRCVDRGSYEFGDYKVLPSSECSGRGSAGGSSASGSGSGYSSGGYGSDTTARNPQWYYGGNSSSSYAYDGSFNKSAVSRGGFGCSGPKGG